MRPPDSPERGARRLPRAWIGLAGLVALGFALRLLKAGSQSFWHDEAYTVAIVRADFAGMLAQVADTERTPYLYYAVAWAWAQFFGDSELALRSLSVIFGVATIVVVYAAGARLFSRPAGLIAALLVTLNPLLIWYSQEARSYALVTFLAALSLLGFAGSLTAGRRSDYALWSLASAAAVATHYFAALPVLVEGLLLLRIGDRRRRFAVAVAFPAAVAVALIPLAAEQAARTADPVSPLIARLVQTLTQFLLGENAPSVTGRLPKALLALLVLVAIVIAWRSSRSRLSGRLGACAAIAIAAPIVATLGAAVGPDFFIGRNMIVGAPAAVVALGGLFVAARPAARTAAVAVLCVVFLGGELWMLTSVSLQRADLRRAGAIVQPAHGCDAVLVYPAYEVKPLALYQPNAQALPSAGAEVRGVGVLWTIDFKRLKRQSPLSWWSSWASRRVGPLPPPAADMKVALRDVGPGFRYVRYAGEEPRRLGPDDLAATEAKEPRALLVCGRVPPRAP